MMKKTQTERSWFTTTVAAIFSLIVIVLIFPLIPLKDWVETLFFGFGILIVILCLIVAIDGKKGTIKDLMYSLIFWK